MKALHSILAAASMVAFSACAPGATMDGPAGPQKGVQQATVRVQNQNWQDMVVYLVRGTTRTRLGTVTAMNSQTFRVPRASLGASGLVRLMADPIGGGRAYTSEVLTVRPGQRVSLDVGHSLAISFVSVWN